MRMWRPGSRGSSGTCNTVSERGVRGADIQRIRRMLAAMTIMPETTPKIDR